jgi:hypothetical protein
MNWCSLNCRGVGNSATVREVCVLQRAHRFQLIFLCETRQKGARVRRLRSRLGLRGFTSVDCTGMSGVLALFWHESYYVDIKEANDHFIDAFIRTAPDEPLIHATFVYGEPRVEHRFACGIT